MRIGIDARLALGKRRGMGRVLLSLLVRLADIDPDNQYFLYLDRPDTHRVLPAAQNFTARVCTARFYPWWEQVCLPFASLKDDLHLLHCPANTAPFLRRSVPRLVVTLHDLIFLKPLSDVPLSPSTYQNLGRLYRALCSAAVKRADLFITVSEWSRQEIMDRLGIPSDRIRVIPNGVDERFFEIRDNEAAKVLQEIGVRRPYILHLGAVAPHKNTPRAVEAFGHLLEFLPTIELQMVVVGLVPDAARRLLSGLDRLGHALPRIRFLGYVGDHELACLYKGAELLLFPSLYEGFGLPALEAMACGTPVVAARRASIPEVTGDAVLLVDPTEVEEITNAMYRLLVDDSLRSTLASAGRQRALQFRWESAARQLLQAYLDVL